MADALSSHRNGKDRLHCDPDVSGLNRETCKAMGIFYPKTPGDRNHTKLTIFARTARIPDLRRLTHCFRTRRSMLSRLASRRAARRDHGQPLLAHLHVERTSIIRLRSPRRSPPRGHTPPLATPSKFIVYLRSQPEFFLSKYSTASRPGAPTSRGAKKDPGLSL